MELHFQKTHFLYLKQEMYRIHSEEYSQTARRTSTNSKTTLIFSICSWDFFYFWNCSDYPDYIILKNYLFICLFDTAYFWRESQKIVILSPYNAISKHDFHKSSPVSRVYDRTAFRISPHTKMASTGSCYSFIWPSIIHLAVIHSFVPAANIFEGSTMA